MMKNILFLALVILFISPLYAQDNREEIYYSYKPEAIANSQSLVWYGYDLRFSHMLDQKKFGDEEIIVKDHIPGIQTILEELYKENYVKKLTNKDNVIIEMPTVHDLADGMNPENFMVRRNINITIEELKSIVKEYNLPQNEGLGLVTFVEMFNKTDTYVSAYIIFFDIKTREVYHATRTSSSAGGKGGFNQYWANGIINLTRDYLYGKNYRRMEKGAVSQ